MPYKTTDGRIFDSREEAYGHDPDGPITPVYDSDVDGPLYPPDEYRSTPEHVDPEDPDTLITQLEDTIRAHKARIRSLEDQIQAYKYKTVPITTHRELKENYDTLLSKHQALEEHLHNLEALNTPLQPRRTLPFNK